MVSSAEKVAPLVAALEKNGFPVGGTGNSVSMIAHTQGWLHCDIPGTDASGAVKALMDDLYTEFIREEMPNRVHMSTSCCEINCGGQADIAIIIQHTKPPKINHDLVANVCERPAVVARCPVAAIRPALVNGKPSLEVDEKKCICCGACYPPCPPMQINDPEFSKLAIWVGGNERNDENQFGHTTCGAGAWRQCEPSAISGRRSNCSWQRLGPWHHKPRPDPRRARPRTIGARVLGSARPLSDPECLHTR